MARDSQLVRAFRLLRLLARPGGGSLDELATELGVVRRTVYRDLAALEEAGAPLHSDAETWPRRWHVAPGFLGSGGLRVTSEELLALGTLSRLQAATDGTHAAALEALVAKLRTLVPQAVLEEADRLRARTAVPPWPRQGGEAPASPVGLAAAHAPADGSLEGRLQRAIECGEELRVRYRSRSERGTGERVLQPLGLATRPSGSYLLARPVPRPSAEGGDAEGVRKYRLARIEDLEPTGRSFEPPESFDPDSAFAGAFGVHSGEAQRVVVRFGRRAAPFVEERRWHPSQLLSREAHGSLLLTMEVGGLVEVKAWVQSFGADAEVLEPAGLAEEIAGEARRVVRAWAARRLARPLARKDSRGSKP